MSALRFRYTNYKGETADRSVTPYRIYYGTSEHHEGEQWFLLAYCHDRKAMRSFALVDALRPPGGTRDE